MTASRKKTETAPEKKAYQTPSLTKYGQLKDLTTGGTGQSDEGSHKTDLTRHP